MPFDIDPDRLARSPFLVGAAGSFVALRSAPGLTWRERAVNVLCGGVSAGFCAPAMVEWLGIHSQGLQSFCAFSVGMFGLSLSAAITNAIRTIDMASILAGWLSKK